MISKEKLVELYKKQNLTAFEISEVLKVKQEVVISLLKEYEIDTNPTLKKYRLVRGIPMTDEQRQFVVGLLIGNNCRLIAKGKHGFCLRIVSKSKDHLLWVKTVLGNYINVINNDKDGYWCETAKLNDFAFFNKLFYYNNKKVIREELADYLTFFGLAAWFSESASSFKESIRFSTFKFTLEEQTILQRILKVNFGINSKICEYTKNELKYYYISINKRNSQILIQKIKQFH
ncbi:MAG TPA: hypothetical protein VI423_07565 [Paenisporosarcina sp.]|nr:hypothetical protein [Paenisporosarcina sp.]